MKTKRLYDFNLFLAAIILVAFAMMSVLAGFLIAEKPALRGVAIAGAVLLAFGFCMLIWYFVIMAPKLTPEGIVQGKKFIKKANIAWKTEHNERFKERQIIIIDKSLNYNKFDEKEALKRKFIIQCTAKNEQKLTEYLNGDVTA